jgi:hypothetical protein
VLTDLPADSPPPRPVRATRARKGSKPEWADGLRKLYDDVVSEPLPDSFEDLLRRLDQAGND